MSVDIGVCKKGVLKLGVTIVIGGQYGGEGKGKVTYWFAKERDINIAVRVGGTNAGHTVVDENNNKFILRQLPTPSVLKNRYCVLSAGSYIDVDILFKEMKETGLDSDKLLIDENAMIITDSDKELESKGNLRNEIGSTLSGTGASVIRRVARGKNTTLAKDIEALKPFIADTKKYLRSKIQEGQKVIIEGTQGFGLSLLHSPHYPYTTSRDTTASAFLAEAGLSPFDVDEIIMAIRAFPIRVEGNSGALENEINWDEIGREPELSSVTKKVRRIANFDSEIVKKAIETNRPSKIILNHIGYMTSEKQEDFISKVEYQLGQKIDFIGMDNKCLVAK